MSYSVRGLALMGLGLVVACAVTPSDSGSVQAPDSWLKQFGGQESQCQDFDKTYSNEGERQEGSEKKAHSIYLSELMFNRLPGGVLPDSVRLIVDARAGQLLVTLRGETSSEAQFEITCELGWHVLKKTRSGQYLGDGVVEKQYGQISFFRKGRDGELIVRVVVDAEFNSMYVFNSSVQEEAWFRFSTISN